MTEANATRDIVIEEIVPHAPELVWRALTTADLIHRWLMPNDFQPVLGHRFYFRSKPMGRWDGVVHCEVLEVVPHRRLVYSWRGGSEQNDQYGSKLDSVVTWTLEPVGDGSTQLRMVHAGFRSPDNDFAFDAMSGGWGHVVRGICRVIAETSSAARATA